MVLVQHLNTKLKTIYILGKSNMKKIKTMKSLVKYLIENNKKLNNELETIKQKTVSNSNDIELIFKYLKQFEQAKQQELEYQNREKIGFKTKKKDN